MPKKLPPLPPRAKLNLGPGELRYYQYRYVTHYDEREVRLEYRRLYRIYQLRMARLAKSRYTDLYNEQKDRFKPISQLPYRKVQSTIIELARWVLNREYFSVSGQEELRARRLESLHSDDKYSFITDENFDEFGEFMRHYRDTKLDELYDSESAASAFDAIEAVNLPPELVKANFEAFIAKGKQLTKIVTAREHSSPDWESATADELLKFIT